jgi:hypothetical protein
MEAVMKVLNELTKAVLEPGTLKPYHKPDLVLLGPVHSLIQQNPGGGNDGGAQDFTLS